MEQLSKSLRSLIKYIAVRGYTGLFLFIVMIAIPFSGSGQLTRKGTPPSVRFNIESGNSDPVMISSPDPDRIRWEDIASPIPYRFAVNLPVNKGLDRGIWTALPDGGKMWNLIIEAPGAKAVTIYFDRFRLPGGGELFLFNRDKTQILGAYTEENNAQSGCFATELIRGDQVTLEYYQPEHVTGLPVIHISEIAYAYRGVPDPDEETGFGASGPCEVNANCEEGNGWERQKQGVIRIEVKKLGGTYWCSGSVVNNTKQDFLPYILTADHCGNKATKDDLQQWIFYFGYQSTGCPDPTTEPGSQTMTGAVLKARSGDVITEGGSDFYLILLNFFIPGNFDVIYNGWSLADIASPSGVTIHHPMGDIKKISTYTTPLVSTNWSGNPGQTHWRVYWAATANGHGVTEGGSSGAPIFDDTGYIIGTLTGGESSCDSANLNKPDYYGKFSYHWNSNGNDSTVRLDYWLDPVNSGLEILNSIGLGIESLTGSAGLSIFPNPIIKSGSVNEINIQLRPEYFIPGKKIPVTILDSRGRTVLKTEVTVAGSNSIGLDIPDLTAGFYLIQVYTPQGIAAGKLLVQ
jgi:hypothetical protein